MTIKKYSLWKSGSKEKIGVSNPPKRKIKLIRKTRKNDTIHTTNISSSSPPKELNSIEKKLEKIRLDKLSNKKYTLKRRIRKVDKPPTPKSMSVSSFTISPPYNEAFISMLGKLHSIMMSKGEPFRARAYKKAQETILSMTEPILSLEQLKGKAGIGETILSKMKEYIETGTLTLFEREKDNPILMMTNIYGVGPKKAEEIVKKEGIRTIEELRTRGTHLLNDKQRIGLEYYEDILERIPRSEIDEYKEHLTTIFNDVIDRYNGEKGGDGFGISSFEIVGSYRRGATDSGDIDIILTNSVGDASILPLFIQALQQEDILIEILSQGSIKTLGISRLTPSSKARRIDFMFSPPEEYAFAILYFTGSASFNTVMRQRALDKGYTMNEHGLYKLIDGKKDAKLDIYFPDERSIFDILDLEYKEPTERKDGSAVKMKDGTPVKITPTTEKVSISIVEPTQPKKRTLKKKKTTTLTMKPKTTKEYIETFQKEGVDYLDTLTDTILATMIRDANTAYYNETALMTDNQFDILKEYMERKYPKHKVLKEIGAVVENVKQKVKLPYYMGSMDKIKPDTDALQKWKSMYKSPYVLSTKLDGISGLYVVDGNTMTLYTRGDGYIGQDVSHLIKYLNLPNLYDDSETVYAIRGELIMKKTVFEEKYKTEASNIRNLVGGIVNAKTPMPSKYRDLDFVAYEVIEPRMKPSEQFEFLRTKGFLYAKYEHVDTITNELLSERLVDWRENYEYEIDGVIVTQDGIYPRIVGSNPDYAFAFKMVLSDQVVESKVVDVLWTPSKDGYLKPRVRIEPVVIGGAMIEYATGFNAKFIVDNNIGIGAVVQLVRSGDVIPHIMSVITPAPEPKMPNDIEYVWNETNIDIVLVDIESDRTVRLKNITSFFTGIEVAGLSSGNVKRLMDAGYDSVGKILRMTVDDFLKVDGFKEKSATKLYENIQSAIQKASLSKIMNASNIFGRGFGEKRIDALLDTYPTILTSKDSDAMKKQKILGLEGFGEKTASSFVERIPMFMKFVEQTGLMSKVIERTTPPKKTIDTSHPLYQKTIVMTGFRSKELEQKIKDVGGVIGSSVSKQTFIVLTKDVDESTGKLEKARSLGIRIMTPDEFETTYF